MLTIYRSIQRSQEKKGRRYFDSYVKKSKESDYANIFVPFHRIWYPARVIERFDGTRKYIAKLTN
jgi:hypothetical protein